MDIVRQDLQLHPLVVTILAMMTNTILLLCQVDVIWLVLEESDPAGVKVCLHLC